MKKFLTLLSAAFIAVASFATVASAAEDVYKPTVALDITNVLPNGNAIITATLNVEKELDFNNQGDGYDWVNGSGVSGWQVDMNLNTEIFKKDNAIVTGNYSLDFSKVKASKNGVVTIGTANIALNDSYKTMNKADLNKLNFAEVTKAVFEITEWKDSFDVMDASAIVSQTNYRSDGEGGAIVIDLSKTRIGDYVEIEEPTVTWNAADADWEAETGKKAIWWEFKFADGSFGGHQFITVTDGADAPTTKTVGVGAAEDYKIDGDVEFAVAVIFDEAPTDEELAKFDAYVGR